METLARRLAVARGDEPADLVVRGGRVLSVFTREWLEARHRGRRRLRRGAGRVRGPRDGRRAGRYVVPGFVDAHVHIESTKLLVDEFARLVLPLGTTAIVADPHEIANVLGTDGVHWLLDACREVPLDVFFMASSSVPASQFESPRRPLSTGDLGALLRRRGARPRRDDELPGRRRGRSARAGEARARRRRSRRRPRPGRPRQGAERLRRRRHPLRPRGVHGRGGTAAAARRDVGADPGGVGGAEPARPAAARARVRAAPDGVLHRRP